jgi:AraC-like DNA-binding protein
MYIRILTCKQAVIDSRWNYPDMLCTYWRLYINDACGAKVISNGREYPLEKDKIYIIPSWQKVSLLSETRLRNFYVHFDLIGITEHLSHKLFPVLMEFDKDPTFDKNISIAYEKPSNKFMLDCRLKSLIYELLHKYFRGITAAKKDILEKLLPAAGKYASLFEYIDNNLGQNIENSVLARVCSKSQSHFIRDFSEAVGITPAKFVTQRRISKAIEIMMFTNESIDRIAFDTGFTDRFHFSKVFKNITGITPAAYRKHMA